MMIANSGEKAKRVIFNGQLLEAFPLGEGAEFARRMRPLHVHYFRLALGKIGKPITRSGCKQPERAVE